MSSPHLLRLPIWVSAIFACLLLPILVSTFPVDQPFLPDFDPPAKSAPNSLSVPFTYGDLDTRALHKRDDPETPKNYQYARRTSQGDNGDFYYSVADSLTAYNEEKYIAEVYTLSDICEAGQGIVWNALVTYNDKEKEDFHGAMKDTDGPGALYRAELQRKIYDDEGKYPEPVFRVPKMEMILWVKEGSHDLPAQTVVVMQKLDGELVSLMNTKYDRVLTLLEIMRAVRDSHNSGVIHRDLKPNNVMFIKDYDDDEDDGGNLAWYLIDFDLAVDINDLQKSPHWTRRVGTPTYIPPDWPDEQHPELLPAIDVWLLARTHYAMLNPALEFSKDPRTGQTQVTKLMSFVYAAVTQFPSLYPEQPLKERLHKLSTKIQQLLLSGFHPNLRNHPLLRVDTWIIAQILVPQSHRPSLYWYYSQFCDSKEGNSGPSVCDDRDDPRWQVSSNTGCT